MLLTVTLLAPAACGPSAPQIVDYAPARGSTDVPTNFPITVEFDRPVARASVQSRFHLEPAAAGRLTWPSGRQFVFTPRPSLQTNLKYRVVLDAGYAAEGGGSGALRHEWLFTTETAPTVTGFDPAPGSVGVDPAAYLHVSFSRPVDQVAIQRSVQLIPPAQVRVAVSASDRSRVLISPVGLLRPDQPYRLRVTTAARDSDGNGIAAAQEMDFVTGPVRPLHHWLTFASSAPERSPDAGLWVVDENDLPRRLESAPLLSFSWAPGGADAILQTGPRTWSQLPLGGALQPLPFGADWAAALSQGQGWAYLDGGRLKLVDTTGSVFEVAGGVDAVRVSPSGVRVAYTVPSPGGTEVWAISVELHSRFRLQLEPGAVQDLAWSPDESRLSYRLSSASGTAIRVLGLAGGATTVATGPVASPAWDSDSQHLYVLGSGTAGEPPRVYRVSALAPGQAVSGPGIPPGSQSAGAPLPSPDGHQVAFLALASGGDTAIWLMNADGTALTQLTGGPAFPYSCRALEWTLS